MLARLASFIATVFRGIWALFSPSPPPAQRRGEPVAPGPDPIPAPAGPDGDAGDETGRRRVARVALVYYFQLDKDEAVPDLASMTATYAARRMAAQGGDVGHESTP